MKLLTKETVNLTIFFTIFVTIVLFFNYHEQDENKEASKINEYVFSKYQLDNGLYISFNDQVDDSGYVSLVLVHKDLSQSKIAKTKEQYLSYANGPLSSLSRKFYEQQLNYEQAKKELLNRSNIKQDNSSQKLPLLKIKHL